MKIIKRSRCFFSSQDRVIKYQTNMMSKLFIICTSSSTSLYITSYPNDLHTMILTLYNKDLIQLSYAYLSYLGRMFYPSHSPKPYTMLLKAKSAKKFKGSWRLYAQSANKTWASMKKSGKGEKKISRLII